MHLPIGNIRDPSLLVDGIEKSSEMSSPMERSSAVMMNEETRPKEVREEE